MFDAELCNYVVISPILLSKYTTTCCRVGPGRTSSAYDYIACCLCICVWHVLSPFNAVWGCNLVLIMCCSNTPRWRLCIDLHCLNIWHGYRIDSGQKNSKYVSVLKFKGVIDWRSIRYGVVTSLTLMRYTVAPTHYNGDDGPALILNECMELPCVLDK